MQRTCPGVTGIASVLAIGGAAVACGGAIDRDHGADDTGGAPGSQASNGTGAAAPLGVGGAGATTGPLGVGGTGATDSGSNAYCERSTTIVGWGDTTVAGVPGEVFASFVAVPCEAPFQWGGAGWSGLTIAPASGADTLRSVVALDAASVRLVEQSARPDAPDAYQYLCRSTYLEVDASVSLTLLGNGTVVSQQVVALTGTSDAPPTALELELDPEVGNWIAIVSDDPDTAVGLRATVEPPAARCAGAIALTATTTTSSSSGGVAFQGSFGVSGSFASWSSEP